MQNNKSKSGFRPNKVNSKAKQKKILMMALLVVFLGIQAMNLTKSSEASDDIEEETEVVLEVDSNNTSDKKIQEIIGWDKPGQLSIDFKDPMGGTACVSNIVLRNVSKENLMVSAIVYSDVKPMALINGTQVTNGSVINGVEVLEIGPNYVKLKKGNDAWDVMLK